jgi:hypothetical protein
MTVKANAILDDAGTAFEALVIDTGVLKAGGKNVVNGFDYTNDLSGKLAGIKGQAAVMLLDNVAGDLTFNTTTILDLNGKNINGNIVANGTVYIVDSSMDTLNAGAVTGSVSGNAVIFGGNYSTDVTAYLKDGYQQVSGNVQNVLYTIEEALNGDLTFKVNTEVVSAGINSYTTFAKTVAVDIAVDLLLNYMGTATPSEKLENGMVVFYEVTDLVLGDDGIYRTPEGDTVYIAVDNKGDFGISLLDRFTLLDIVVEHGLMMDLTHWDALTASMDDDGYVVLTEKTLGYLVTLLTGNPDLGATEADAALMLFYDAEQIHRHAYMQAVTAPTCTQQGYTTYTCSCGDSYVDDYVDALGHKYENGICTGCGQAEPEAPLGDVNSDGKIDAMDACCIVRYYRETLELTEKQLKTADVDGNGRVDLADACCIALFHSGKISVFPGQK